MPFDSHFTKQNSLVKTIGIGHLGCMIVDQLRSYPEYEIYKFTDEAVRAHEFSLGTLKTMEEYESSFPYEEAISYLRTIKRDDNVVVFMEGGEAINGCLLRVLEIIKDTHITFFFVRPSLSLKGDAVVENTRLTFGVCQEYARSGIFERMIFLDKDKIESLVGDVPITAYEERIAQLIAYKFAMMMFFENSDFVMSNIGERPLGCRIATFGVSSLEDENPQIYMLHNLEKIRTVEFYYGISQEDIDEDASLVNTIKSHVTYISDSLPDNPSFTYGVSPLQTEEKYLLGLFYISEPQKL